MGVPGLWEVLNPVGTSTSLAQLAVVNGFETNISRLRAYRIGIDASIWFHHAAFSKGGENPELRGLFFKLVFLAKLPIVPVFVLDGRLRPKVKRGSKLGKSGSHGLAIHFKRFVNAFGMEWHEAPGEAEAELASLNQKGYIDAILTDDCDAFIFGAQTIIKNISSKLSGNKGNLAKNSEDKTDNYHTMLYTATDIKEHPLVAMSKAGLMLFALLSGGDYHKGVEKIGKKIAHGLARCEFGDQLLDAYQTLRGPPFERFLEQWRAQVNAELRENRRGFLPHRTSLSLPHGFPDLSVLEKYANPLTSGGSSSVALRDQGNFDPAQIAALCEEFFEWGYRSKIIERFRNFLWPCAVIHVLRRMALKVDERERSGPSTQQVEEGGISLSAIKRYLTNATKRVDVHSISNAFVNRGPSSSLITGDEDLSCLITKIIGSRQHASTDGILEYRIEVLPTQLVEISNTGIKGTRREPPGAPETRNRDTDPNSPLRLWVAASILRRVYPRIVDEFVNRSQSSRNRKRWRQSLEISSDATDNVTSLMALNHSPLRYGNNHGLRGLSDTLDTRKGGSREVLLLDPWFLTAVPSESLGRRQSTGFLFGFCNPEPPEIVGEDPEIATDEKSHHDPPSTRFQRFCDQILTAPSRNSRRSKKRKVVEQAALNVQGPSKRPRTSAALDALDLM
ncbi:hypothetical protein M413DRAFT_441836 [Hebeloma cylindrosporum]|uniref:XPG-I domain-containing protein n=1 Tax=Hebeloma cylindrosporum TaxID=76867 RepID=A0A0C2Y5Q7_HEBCY|nr:hypothetical protein M413DRAFT_441836 [Hebeloma cylindrosporum h7]